MMLTDDLSKLETLAAAAKESFGDEVQRRMERACCFARGSAAANREIEGRRTGTRRGTARLHKADGEASDVVTLVEMGPRRLKLPCSYPGCTREGLANHEMCERHRDYHRVRNRQWKRLARYAWKQIGLGL